MNGKENGNCSVSEILHQVGITVSLHALLARDNWVAVKELKLSYHNGHI